MSLTDQYFKACNFTSIICEKSTSNPIEKTWLFILNLYGEL
jgi:hypothetical protein